MIPAAAGLAATTAGTGVLLLILGATTRHDPSRARRRSLPTARVLWARHRTVVLAGVVGLVAAAWSGWWVLVAALPAAVLGLPTLLRRPGGEEAARLGDLESWVRGLAGTLVGGAAGLRQALRDSAAGAPPTLRESLLTLAARLDAGLHLPDALRAWADDLDDPTVDLVAACLIAEDERRGGTITPALERIADTVAEETADRRQVAADRAGATTTVRWVTVITLVLLVVLVTQDTFSAFYTTAIGQATTVVLAAAYSGCLVWMRKVAKGQPAPRFLSQKQLTTGSTR